MIQRLELVPRFDKDEPEARRNFQVQAANDKDFTKFEVLSEQNAIPFAYGWGGWGGASNSWIKHLNNPRGYRYLRVKKVAGGKLNCSEFRAYGYPVTRKHQ